MKLKADPKGILRATRRELSSRSLVEFFRLFWPVLEPGTQLVLGPALQAILEHLEAFFRGDIRRLLINVPPGFSKSMATSVFGPAWLWGPHGRPDKRVIATSYAGDLAVRDNLYCRTLMQSDEYRECWGEVFGFSGDQNAKTRFQNTKGGWRQVASVGSALTGHRGDFIIVDDPHSTKSAESVLQRRAALRWFTETLPTRLNDSKRSGIVVIMQRLHTNDVSGHILAKDLGYEHLCIPMEYEPDHPFKSTRWTDWRTERGELADPVRFPADAVDELKRVFRSQGGTYAEAGQLAQRPIPRGGGMFKEEWFRFRPTMPTPEEIAFGPVRGWDLAATDDEAAAYTASVKGCLLRTGELCILHAVRDQLEPAGVYEFLQSVTTADGPDVVQSIPQDPGQAGKDQKKNIAKHLHGATLHFSPESGSKATRAAGVAGQAQAGNLVLVESDAWNDDLVGEAVEFPRGQWMDLVDAMSRMYARLVALQGTGGQEVPAGARVIGR